MQAKLATQETVEILPDRNPDDVWERLWRASCAHVLELKEELRIAKSSWNCEEGKRIIAERDEILAQRNNALADVDRLGRKHHTSDAIMKTLQNKLYAAEAEVESLKKQLHRAERTGTCPRCGSGWTIIEKGD